MQLTSGRVAPNSGVIKLAPTTPTGVTCNAAVDSDSQGGVLISPPILPASATHLE